MPKLTVQIALASERDLDIIPAFSRDMIESGLGWRYRPAKLRGALRDPARNLVVARLDRQLAGFGLMSYWHSQANLDLLGTLPGYQRRGVATQVVRWLLRVAEEAGLFNTFVQLRSGNGSALAFYRSLGFEVLEEIEGYYHRRENAVMMAKALRSPLAAWAPDR